VCTYEIPLIAIAVTTKSAAGTTRVQRPLTPQSRVQTSEIVRTVLITYVLARLIVLLGGGGWKRAVGLAVLVWFGFSAMMWLGAIMWEGTPWQIAAIHSGDWLLKTILICFVLGVKQ
jgi:Protein of unknown function (DUF1761)